MDFFKNRTMIFKVRIQAIEGNRSKDNSKTAVQIKVDSKVHRGSALLWELVIQYLGTSVNNKTQTEQKTSYHGQI